MFTGNFWCDELVWSLIDKKSVKELEIQLNRFFFFFAKKKDVFGVDSLASRHVIEMNNTTYVIGALLGLSLKPLNK